MNKLTIGFFLVVAISCGQKPNILSVDKWTKVIVDSTRAMWGEWDEPDWGKYIGIGFGDYNNNGFIDIVSGRYIYFNPAGDITEKWERVDLGKNIDGIFIHDIDNDGETEIIAQALPVVYYLEKEDDTINKWEYNILDSVPPTDHANSQGYIIRDIFSGGNKEIIIASQTGIFITEVSTNNGKVQTNNFKICENFSEEGIEIIDINADGKMDIVAGNSDNWENRQVPTYLTVYIQPDTVINGEYWDKVVIGTTAHAIDRIETADINNDGLTDVIVSEERYPGLEPDANLYVFYQPAGHDMTTEWEKQVLVTQYSMNNLDVADMDNDGYIDIVTSEHKGTKLETQIWLNQGNKEFKKQSVGFGVEYHLGTQLIDFDNDGDLDIVGMGWDKHKYLTIWRNDAIR